MPAANPPSQSGRSVLQAIRGLTVGKLHGALHTNLGNIENPLRGPSAPRSAQSIRSLGPVRKRLRTDVPPACNVSLSEIIVPTADELEITGVALGLRAQSSLESFDYYRRL